MGSMEAELYPEIGERRLACEAARREVAESHLDRDRQHGDAVIRLGRRTRRHAVAEVRAWAKGRLGTFIVRWSRSSRSIGGPSVSRLDASRPLPGDGEVGERRVHGPVQGGG